MKNLLFILSFLILLGCQQENKTKLIGTETIQGKLSFKREVNVGVKYSRYEYYLYVQNPTVTRTIEVDFEAYNKYKIGDPVLLIIQKFEIPCEEKKNDDWKKPKINYHQINLHN